MSHEHRAAAGFLATWIAASLVSASLATAQTPAPDPHQHGAESGPAQQAAPQAPPAGGPGSGTAMPGGGMMGGMMPMMEMMMRHHAMAMESATMPGAAMADRVEGRIAFLRAELRITDAQARMWDDLAQALRDNAKTLAELRPAAGRAGAATTLPQKLDQQERWFAARTEGIRTIRSALSRLYPALSDEQKRTADELMPMNLGLMPMAMGPMVGGQGAPMPMRPPPRRGSNP
jgi:hypothetical protein